MELSECLLRRSDNRCRCQLLQGTQLHHPCIRPRSDKCRITNIHCVIPWDYLSSCPNCCGRKCSLDVCWSCSEGQQVFGSPWSHLQGPNGKCPRLNCAKWGSLGYHQVWKWSRSVWSFSILSNCRSSNYSKLGRYVWPDDDACYFVWSSFLPNDV